MKCICCFLFAAFVKFNRNQKLQDCADMSKLLDCQIIHSLSMEMNSCVSFIGGLRNSTSQYLPNDSDLQHQLTPLHLFLLNKIPTVTSNLQILVTTTMANAAPKTASIIPHWSDKRDMLANAVNVVTNWGLFKSIIHTVYWAKKKIEDKMEVFNQSKCPFVLFRLFGMK
jgi:hypothetical protein